MIYLYGAILAAFLGLGVYAHFHGESRYEDGKTDCNNAWVAKGAQEKAEEKARNDAAAAQSAADAKAVADRIGPLAAAIRKGRESAAQPIKVVHVFPAGCKVSQEVVLESNR